ncbi:hypothetical protein CVT26_014767 [Gymnopilus dilepis]|uniref:Uncharacterized protein n=1 Tax=Gymnopilus dilepis TaxID=231916 RepID=A0A409X3Z5_9AGAR|nr:hypothetical protein CVT26_014767 [Gymnopilus dilepis]
MEQLRAALHSDQSQEKLRQTMIALKAPFSHWMELSDYLMGHLYPFAMALLEQWSDILSSATDAFPPGLCAAYLERLDDYLCSEHALFTDSPTPVSSTKKVSKKHSSKQAVTYKKSQKCNQCLEDDDECCYLKNSKKRRCCQCTTKDTKCVTTKASHLAVTRKRKAMEEAVAPKIRNPKKRRTESRTTRKTKPRPELASTPLLEDNRGPESSRTSDAPTLAPTSHAKRLPSPDLTESPIQEPELQPSWTTLSEPKSPSQSPSEMVDLSIDDSSSIPQSALPEQHASHSSLPVISTTLGSDQNDEYLRDDQSLAPAIPVSLTASPAQHLPSPVLPGLSIHSPSQNLLEAVEAYVALVKEKTSRRRQLLTDLETSTEKLQESASSTWAAISRLVESCRNHDDGGVTDTTGEELKIAVRSLQEYTTATGSAYPTADILSLIQSVQEEWVYIQNTLHAFENRDIRTFSGNSIPES